MAANEVAAAALRLIVFAQRAEPRLDLVILVKAGLIVERRRGQFMFYEVRRDVIAAYAAELIRRVAPASRS